nr:MAG TPA: hypothetical protein [Bacteriophage sp.]
MNLIQPPTVYSNVEYVSTFLTKMLNYFTT